MGAQIPNTATAGWFPSSVSDCSCAVAGFAQSGKQKAESRNDDQEFNLEIGKAENRNQFQLLVFGVSAFCFLAFLYLPTRLIEEATPEWRPIQWALGCEAIGLTLCAIYLGKGRGWLRQMAFPICFFFVAIPWPALIEATGHSIFDPHQFRNRG